MSSPPDDSQFLAPRPQQSQPPSGSIGEPRGEEFDLAHLDKPDESAPKSKWNRPWSWAAGLLGLYCFYFWVYGLGVRAQRPMPLGPITAKSASASTVRVHVAGAVRKPGVYALGADARISDALQKAGGAVPNADPNALNLAAFVEDGAKIEVPLKAKVAPQVTPTPVVIIKEVPVAAPETAPSAASETAPSSSAPPSSVPARSSEATPSSSSPITTTKTAPTAPSGHKDEAQLRLHPVNLNTASLDELQRLPGVGPKMAERILAYRQENGRFKSLADLDNVKGIGEKRMEKLGPLVVVK